MKIALSLSEARLDHNFATRRARYLEALPPKAEALRNVPVTHTFPSFKAWKSPDGTEHRSAVYRQILLDDGELLSDQSRQVAGKFMPDEPRPTANAWRAAGLDHFVTAYHGVHDPYYATRRPSVDFDGINRAFGVFARQASEVFPNCNATTRDLEVLSADDIENAFLKPADARELVQCEWASGDHFGDFWYYWGSPEHWLNASYLSNMWKWKYEFHFRDRVALAEIAAVLWPRMLGMDVESGGWVPSTITLAANELRRLHPHCTVLEYEANGNHLRSFMNASYAVALYNAVHKAFPTTVEDALVEAGVR